MGSSSKQTIALILCAILSAVVLNTCVRIEFWNQLAGGKVLPNREGGKLRYSPLSYEDLWRAHQSARTRDPTLKAGRNLTPEEQALYQQESKRAKAWNKVVSWTSGMGLCQYILAPIAFIASVLLLYTSPGRRWMHRVSALLVLSNLLCIILMLYRGYLND